MGAAAGRSLCALAARGEGDNGSNIFIIVTSHNQNLKVFCLPGQDIPKFTRFQSCIAPRQKIRISKKNMLPSFPPSLPRCIKLSKVQNFQIVLAIFEFSEFATQNQDVHIKFKFSRFQFLFGLIPEPTTI